MAIVSTISDSNEFANWVAQSDSYKNNFTWEGAIALQEYLEQYSDDVGENIEFDPIAWCCEYSEYKDYQDAYEQIGDGTITDPKVQETFIYENTETYEFDGGVIVRDF